jgi:KilA-N domain
MTSNSSISYLKTVTKKVEERPKDCLRCGKSFQKQKGLYTHLFCKAIDCNPKSEVSYEEAKKYANIPDYYKCSYCHEILIDSKEREEHKLKCDKKNLNINYYKNYIKDENNKIVTMIDEKTNYYNITLLCKYVDKELNEFMSNNSTKNFINVFKEKNKNIENPIIEKVSLLNPNVNHIYCHPYIFTHTCCWISSEFFYKVTEWIDKSKKDIILEYHKEISKIKKDEYFLKEKEIQIKLVDFYNAEKEIKTNYGYIDVLTNDKIIEIKHIDNYKNALGQILFYSFEYPDREKIIYLFSEEEILEEKKNNIKKVCDLYNIIVEYEICI